MPIKKEKVSKVFRVTMIFSAICSLLYFLLMLNIFSFFSIDSYEILGIIEPFIFFGFVVILPILILLIFLAIKIKKSFLSIIFSLLVVGIGVFSPHYYYWYANSHDLVRSRFFKYRYNFESLQEFYNIHEKDLEDLVASMANRRDRKICFDDWNKTAGLLDNVGFFCVRKEFGGLKFYTQATEFSKGGIDRYFWYTKAPFCSQEYCSCEYLNFAPNWYFVNYGMCEEDGGGYL